MIPFFSVFQARCVFAILCQIQESRLLKSSTVNDSKASFSFLSDNWQFRFEYSFWDASFNMFWERWCDYMLNATELHACGGGTGTKDALACDIYTRSRSDMRISESAWCWPWMIVGHARCGSARIIRSPSAISPAFILITSCIIESMTSGDTATLYLILYLLYCANGAL